MVGGLYITIHDFLPAPLSFPLGFFRGEREGGARVPDVQIKKTIIKISLIITSATLVSKTRVSEKCMHAERWPEIPETVTLREVNEYLYSWQCLP